MSSEGGGTREALIVAVPETAGSALYGMLDILAATGTLWQQLVGVEPSDRRIRPRIVSDRRGAFQCGHGIPVHPDFSVADDPRADLVILPEIWLGPDEEIVGRYGDILAWVRRCHARGAFIYSACSGTIMLAETGLLNGRPATSHWAFERAFRTRYAGVDFRPEPALQFADAAGRIVTAGGTTSWHDLAVHIIARHCSPGEALRIAKAYLLKSHHEGQLPYATLVCAAPHADSAVRECEKWLADAFRAPGAIAQAVARSTVPERSLKRRFKTATGLSLIDYLQNLRIEEAKRLLESTDIAIDEISASVGYDNPSFFRRLFKRRCGMQPSDYRRMFQRLSAQAAMS